MKISIRKYSWWVIWIVASLLLTAYYANALVGTDKSEYLPGKTTDGHYQIEMQCDTCHTDPFDGKDALQKSCVKCHKEELKRVEDSHPKTKFTDPRNADRIAILDARYCITCHVEHKTEKTMAMGVTMPEDYCFLCHQDVAKNRPSHKGMGFETCDDAGCHNYHDNKALYEDYLVKHAGEAPMLANMKMPERELREHFIKQEKKYAIRLSAAMIDAPTEIDVARNIVHQWESTAHAKTGVNCRSCHELKNEWIFKPTYKNCETCHHLETEGFLQSRHGMRLAEGLEPMTPKLGRLDLKQDKYKELTCNTCHSDHNFDTEKAAIDACLGCHKDEHSKAYRKSKHYQAYREAKLTNANDNVGVTCASCHMPRVERRDNGEKRIIVDHNQNNTLRPNEKMVRAVCMNCHGLQFSLESLADTKLIETNFNGKPTVVNEGFAMALEREDLKRRGLIKDDDD